MRVSGATMKATFRWLCRGGLQRREFVGPLSATDDLGTAAFFASPASSAYTIATATPAK